jgi:hypothetical protein
MQLASKDLNHSHTSAVAPNLLTLVCQQSDPRLFISIIQQTLW